MGWRHAQGWTLCDQVVGVGGQLLGGAQGWLRDLEDGSPGCLRLSL